MKSPEVSVVIPCFNNMETLPRLLDILSKEEKVNSEIIVVDNGSSDGSKEYLKKRSAFQENLVFLTEEKRGAGAARNKGAFAAKSSLLLFLGGDIVPSKNLLMMHVKFHKIMNNKKAGCLGFVTWSPDLPPTPFMVFLEHGGPQNAFDEIAGKTEVDPSKFFYGSNISLYKEMFVALGGFDSNNFSVYGWEDTELGIRLGKVGFRLFYEPQARGYHWHRLTPEDMRKRMAAVGSGFVTMGKIHADMEEFNVVKAQKKYWPRRIIFGWLLGGMIWKLTLYCETRFVWIDLFNWAIAQSYYNSVHETAAKNKKVWINS